VLPRVNLAQLPTPVDDSPALFAMLPGVASVSVKRDDLTSERYGGNKVRKLEFLLGQALAEKRRAVITFGAYGSNHALATAVHALALGLEPHVVLSPQEPGPFAAATLRAHAGIGTVIHPIEGWDGRREAVVARNALLERDGIEPFVIPMGGTSALGALGYVNAALELVAQSEADVVYVAGGTLGTAVGLAVGFAAVGVPTRVAAVRVTPVEVASDEFAYKLAAETIALLSSVDPSFPDIHPADLKFTLRHDWFEPGYGVATPEASAAVAAARDAGIKTETTYTGKTLAALFSDARSGALAGEKAIFLDTYNSAPPPDPGSVELLPKVLQEYVAECDRLFPEGGAR
jgi:D-cysteine desulfhydrase